MGCNIRHMQEGSILSSPAPVTFFAFPEEILSHYVSHLVGSPSGVCRHQAAHSMDKRKKDGGGKENGAEAPAIKEQTLSKFFPTRKAAEGAKGMIGYAPCIWRILLPVVLNQLFHILSCDKKLFLLYNIL